MADSKMKIISNIDDLFERISELIERARTYVVNSVNVAEVKTRYEVGRYIFEDEQQGGRAAYGKQVLRKLSERLIQRYGNDWSYDTLIRCRKFYTAYHNAEIVATPLPQLENNVNSETSTDCGNGVTTIPLPRFTLSWSHYLILMRIENLDDRYVRQEFEKPTIGILLCESKKDSLVELTLPKDANIYASQYRSICPTRNSSKAS